MNTISHNIMEVDPDFFGQLHAIWLASVAATHTFLTDADIQKISPLVLQGLASGRTFAITDNTKRICGFMNIAHTKIEMLFMHPECFGRGYGKALVQYAQEKHNVQYVDVNEQNEQALQFYLHLGFRLVGRSALDSSGAPFPLLHLAKL